MSKKKEIGLGLSGGGQRAGAFHLGVLTKLNEMGVLDKINFISSISGGSIIGAYYSINKSDFEEFRDNFIEILKLNIERKVFLGFATLVKIFSLICLWFFFFYLTNSIGFTIAFALLSIIIFFIFLFKIFDLSGSLNKVYDKYLYKGKSLPELSKFPKLIINAANLQTGNLITFTENDINDSAYFFDYGKKVKFNVEEFPISLAVTASSCYPPFFNPVKMNKENILISELKPYVSPLMVDGGSYDNQGIYEITQVGKDFDCNIIICSDASAPYSTAKQSDMNPYRLLRWVIDILYKRVRTLQIRKDVYDIDPGIDEIAYISLDWKYEKCIEGFADAFLSNKLVGSIVRHHSIPQYLSLYKDPIQKEQNRKEIIKIVKESIGYTNIIENCLSDEEIDELSKIGTRLCGLSAKQISDLGFHGAILAEIQIKLYCPSLVNSI